jgi:hypothetical protein
MIDAEGSNRGRARDPARPGGVAARQGGDRVPSAAAAAGTSFRGEGHMWDAVLPRDLLKQAIRQTVSVAPVSFVQLTRFLPQLRGQDDLAVSSGFILWRGLSAAGVAALQALHDESAIFFWLCSPAVYANTGDAPFLRLMSGSHRIGEHPWLPTLLYNRAPTTQESRTAVREYVAEIARFSRPSM